MSKAIIVNYRNAITLNIKQEIEAKFRKIEQKILPDNISPNPLKMSFGETSALCVYNPVSTVSIKNTSICLGYATTDNWINFNSTQTEIEGTYSIYRENSKVFQLLTDPLGTRTIWYYFNEEFIVASSSQVAIINFLESFKFNKKVIPWMLSSGTIGYDNSWDERIKRLKANSILNLNKDSWHLSIEEKINYFSEEKDSVKESKLKLEAALEDVFRKFDVESKNFVLPLSGGYDSRGILLYMKKYGNASNLKTVTWGLEESMKSKENDAFIAKQVANYCNVHHTYLHTNLSDEPIDEIFHRFMVNGEGRVDLINGYLDGFKIWKMLFEQSTDSIIRGDEVFGFLTVLGDTHVRATNNLLLCKDFENLHNVYAKLNIEQELPDYLNKKADETLEEWRDRLYQGFRVPVVLSALNDLKSGYVEVVTPLLFSTILDVVYKTPDVLRTEKKAFIDIMNKISPKIKYAKYGANADVKNILKEEKVVDFLKKTLKDEKVKDFLPEEFINEVLFNLKTFDDNLVGSKLKLKIKTYIKNRIPVSIKNVLRTNVSLFKNVDYNVLAFRIYMIMKMNEMLKQKES